jgi:hypothetical protein
MGATGLFTNKVKVTFFSLFVKVDNSYIMQTAYENQLPKANQMSIITNTYL